jgi:phage repressor protein C with HTH and peptisase S24 domain/DNA-binding XRE family transcriptional regulator
LENIFDLAKSLKELRLSSGKSQSEFAKMLGISQTAWSAYERGDTRPRLPLLIALEAQGYKIEGFTTDAFQSIKGRTLGAVDPSMKSRSLGADLDAMNVTEEEAEWKLARAADFPPDMEVTGELSQKIDEHWRQVKKVAGGHPVPLYSKDDFADRGGFEVPVLHQKLSAGTGSPLPENDEAEAFVRVPARLKRYGKNLAALTVEGDSMYPTLDRGDLVICDSCGWSGEGVYALRMSGEGFVKRITRDPGKIIIISDNPKYPIREYKDDVADFEIIGRVHCAIKNLE